MNDIYFDDGEAKWITLTFENNEEVQCAVLDIFEASNQKTYIALIEEDQIEDPDGQAFLYGYSEDKNGDPVLRTIEDDEEYDIAADAYEEILDTEDLNRILSKEK